MDRLAVYLALHGAIVLVVSLVAGLLLHRTIRLGSGGGAAWHLAQSRDFSGTVNFIFQPAEEGAPPGEPMGGARLMIAEGALADPRPSLIACRTIIGKGAPNKQGTSATHGAALGKDEVAAARAELGWNAAPFEIPADIAANWASAGQRSAGEYAAWQARLAASPARESFTARMAGVLPADTGLSAYLDKIRVEKPNVATRKASEMALEALTVTVPALVGGSADLTGSNNTKTRATAPLTPENYGGRYIYYGIREFGMAAAMNGMALHGGIIPYGGTFLIFSDYCRNAIRLSALQEQRVIYVLTHDSIGLGEDGPTHQPVEHVMSLRAIPNLHVFRPCDAVETAEAWGLALARTDGPSVLALSRQNLPSLAENNGGGSARGAYRLRAATAKRRVVLAATGSEVALAVDVATALAGQGIGADVVSMPCWELFAEQDASYRAEILPDDALLVAIEAGVTLGWERHVGRDGLIIGIDSFGASAPAPDLFAHFGFTVDAIVPQIIAKLGV